MRTKIHVDPLQLQIKVDELENLETFSNRSSLYDALAATDWALFDHAKPLTSAIIALRIAEYKIEPKTQKGKPGRSFGPMTQAHKQAMLEGRRNRRTKALPELRIVTPEARMGLVEKIEKGSKAAALKLMCLACTDYHVAEIKHCPVVSCPIHSVRAYK